MSSERILVVEDHEDTRELLKYNLEAAGFEVRSAVDGHAALELAHELKPGLVILDLMLPGMDGLEVCRRLKKDPTTSGTPVIMLTAKGEEVDRIVGLELGADDYVVKPFSPRELML
ncbi:MAG: response regulator, partial [Proteobacteria bacterium]|nr:response regulator [Pseudomonadota bacterium]MBU1612631.1 response regulator [Pseudomonadota bacterium]